LAKFVATDYNITINGSNFSSSLAAATLDITAEEQDVTSFGSTYRSRIGGLKDASMSLDFHQDFGAAAVDATLFPLIGSIATVVIKPTSGAISAARTRAMQAVFGYAVSAIRVVGRRFSHPER
jgi:hypothetical protein